MVFFNVLLGICYSMVYKIGVVFYIFYGCVNVIYLLYVIKFNLKILLERYVKIVK